MGAAGACAIKLIDDTVDEKHCLGVMVSVSIVANQHTIFATINPLVSNPNCRCRIHLLPLHVHLCPGLSILSHSCGTTGDQVDQYRLGQHAYLLPSGTT